MKTLTQLMCAALVTSASFAQEPNSPPPPPPERGGKPEQAPPPPPGGGERQRPPFEGGPDRRGPGDRGPGDRGAGDRGPGDRGPGERGPGDRGPGERGDRPRGEGDFRRGNPGDRERGPEAGGRRGEPQMPGMDRERPMKPTAYLGVVTGEVPPVLAAQLGLSEGFGLVVENVLPDSPAGTAGVQRYDVLKMFNDQQLVSPSQLAALVRGAGKDKQATLTVLRKGQEQKLTVTIGEKMLPERQGIDFREMFHGFDSHNNVPQELRERMEQFRRGLGGDSSNRGGGFPNRELQERMQNLQKRLNEYQEGLRKWQEKMRQWQEKREGDAPQPPAPPKLDMPSGPPQGSNSVRPTDILREMRPGAATQVRGDWSDGTSRWDANRARVTMRDPEGDMELTVQDGHRKLSVRNGAGETVFAGAVDTPEQRDNIPEPFRAKLAALEVPPPPPGAPFTPPGGPVGEQGGRPFSPRQPDVQ